MPSLAAAFAGAILFDGFFQLRRFFFQRSLETKRTLDLHHALRENMMKILIPAQPHESLEWLKQKEEAARAAESGQKIVWEFDLGLNAPFFPLEDELRFNALALALSSFAKEFWPLFQESTAG